MFGELGGMRGNAVHPAPLGEAIDGESERDTQAAFPMRGPGDRA